MSVGPPGHRPGFHIPGTVTPFGAIAGTTAPVDAHVPDPETTRAFKHHLRFHDIDFLGEQARIMLQAARVPTVTLVSRMPPQPSRQHPRFRPQRRTHHEAPQPTYTPFGQAWDIGTFALDGEPEQHVLLPASDARRYGYGPYNSRFRFADAVGPTELIQGREVRHVRWAEGYHTYPAPALAFEPRGTAPLTASPETIALAIYKLAGQQEWKPGKCTCFIEHPGIRRHFQPPQGTRDRT